MRIWKGKEKEVAIFEGTEMLFIQGEKVNIRKVLAIAKKHNIRQLYFGAGKIEFKDFGKLRFIPKNKYVVIIETINPKQVPLTENLTVIHRIDLNDIMYDMIIKLELTDYILTVWSAQMYKTRKDSLKLETMMYESDELLLEDK